MCVFVLGFCAEEGQVRSELPPSIGLCLASCLRGLGNAACGGSLLEYGRDSPVFGCWADLVKCSQDRAVHIGGYDLHSYKPERVKDTSNVPTRLRQNHVEHALCIPGNARTQQCRRPVAEGVPVQVCFPILFVLALPSIMQFEFQACLLLQPPEGEFCSYLSAAPGHILFRDPGSWSSHSPDSTVTVGS